MTWEKGISAYTGLGYTVEDNRDYLHISRKYGYSRLFTSLHIPEADQQAVVQEFLYLTAYAKRLGFQVTADISPKAFSLLEIAPDDTVALLSLGIDTVRLDFGFTPEEIAAFTQKSDITVEINASSIDRKNLEKIIAAGADVSRLRACHNFYPRPETGLSYDLFAERSSMLRDFGITVTAFIPSRHNPRGPIFAGLPTLEQHRHANPVIAAKHLLISGLVDGISFGDPHAPESELAAVAALDAKCFELEVEFVPDISQVERSILLARHTNRTDPGEHVIRSQEARTLCRGNVPARGALDRPRGAVTIDNAGYLRYMGELQIVCRSLPSDERVNVVAQIVPQELFLLDYIRPGCLFRFKEAR